MENRFGFKDFVTLTLLVLLIVVVWLGMVQSDRQWKVIKTIESQGNQQTDQIATLRRMMVEMASSGGPARVVMPVATGNSTTSPSTSATPGSRVDPFGNLKAAEARPDLRVATGSSITSAPRSRS